MKSTKPIILAMIIVTLAAMLIPAILVNPFSDGDAGGNGTVKKEPFIKKETDVSLLEKSEIEVAVWRSNADKIEKLPLEKYIAGVVAAEMPADFEVEALKAQALTARTYIMNHMLRDGKEANGADVTDTVEHQVYKDFAELKQAWGADYDKKLNKVARAVLETEGQILTYNGKPITATFFSTSNGYTENAEDLWENPYPYLTSVVSPWDESSPKFHHQTEINVKEFEKRLAVKLDSKSIGSIIERTGGNRVASVNINGKVISGQDVREALDLKSTDFSWKRKGDTIIITTKGYGHGVGMSQYGANGMAKEGKDFREIVTHYYQGVEITSAKSVTDQLLVQK